MKYVITLVVLVMPLLAMTQNSQGETDFKQEMLNRQAKQAEQLALSGFKMKKAGQNFKTAGAFLLIGAVAQSIEFIATQSAYGSLNGPGRGFYVTMGVFKIIGFTGAGIGIASGGHNLYEAGRYARGELQAPNNLSF